MVVLGLASCATWDDPTTENYGEGPAISVSAVLATPSDSAITISITPAEGTLYYAFVLDQSDVDESADLDASTLLKGNYGGQVINANEQPVVNVTVGNLAPNTTYQVYAVASSDKGIVGKIANASVTTTDGSKPGISTYSRDAENKAVKLPFSEAVQRGEGAVTARYYKEWDLLNPVVIATEDIEVSISGKTVTLSAPTAPAGAYVTFSYEEGAFVDATGNKCAAINSGLNMTTGRFTGIYVQVPTEAWTITDSNVTSPADGFLFGSIDEFKGELTFDFDIYRVDNSVKTGDLSVTYSSSKHSNTYKLEAGDWAVEGNKLTFVLPANPAAGDFVTLNIVEGAVTDVLGNPNSAFTSSATWQLFVPTEDDVFGQFKFTYISSYDNQLYEAGVTSIVKSEAAADSLVMKDLYAEGSEFAGSFDLNKTLVSIEPYDILGADTYQGETIYLVLYSLSYADNLEFKINADGTITTTDFGIVAYNSDLSAALGWWEKASVATLTKVSSASASRVKAGLSTKKLGKAPKLNVRGLKMLRH